MARFLSFKVAPGVRLSASSRGLRAHLGPRAARFHVGGGRTGVSTGAGPLTVYESVGASTSRGPTRPPSGLTPAQAERLRQVDAARAEFERISQLHRSEFAVAQRQGATRVPLPPFRQLLLTAEKQAFAGVSRFNRAERRAARDAARAQADKWAQDLLTLADQDVQARQAALETQWDALQRNVPEVVLNAIRTAFAAAGRSIRATAVVDGDICLVLTLPGPAAIPDAKPALTPSGAPTLHKISQTERSEWYAQLVASHVLLAAKEAFAAAPGLVAARVVGIDALGLPVVGARVERSRVAAADWRGPAWPVLAVVAPTLRYETRGRTRELVAVDLSGDPVFGPALADTA